MAMIICPDCKNEMSDEASNCPKCGKPVRKSVSFLLGLGIFLFPIIFVWFTLRKGYSTQARIISFGYLLLSIIIGLYMPDIENIKSLRNTSSLEEALNNASKYSITKVNISDILSAYQNNEVAADNRYKGKLVEVTGRIEEIKKDLMDNLYVTLGTGDIFEIPQFQAFFDSSMSSQLGELQKGGQLTVVCRIEGLMMNVIAQNCIIK